MAAAGVAIAIAMVLMVYLRRQNAKLVRGLDIGKSEPTLAQQLAKFRYMLVDEGWSETTRTQIEIEQLFQTGVVFSWRSYVACSNDFISY